MFGLLLQKYQETGWLKQQNYISHSSGGWNSETRVPACSVAGEGPLWFIDGYLLAVSSHGGEREREEASSLVSLLKRARIPS